MRFIGIDLAWGEKKGRASARSMSLARCSIPDAARLV